MFRDLAREGESSATGVSLRYLLLLGSPLCMAVLGLFHPREIGPTALDALSPVVDRWIFIHLLQLPLLGLVTLALCIMSAGLDSVLVRFGRLCAGIFVLFYGAYVAVEGLAIGVLIRGAFVLPAEDRGLVAQSVQDLYTAIEAGDLVLIRTVGEFGWLLATVIVAVSLRRVGTPLAVQVPLILSGILLLFGHQVPWGSLAFLCFFVSAVGSSKACPAILHVTCIPGRGDRIRRHFGLDREGSVGEGNSFAEN